MGIVGGSGLYEMEAMKDTHEMSIATPFGKPSSPIVVGRLEGQNVAFLARHGRGHTLLPSEVNYRANIYALKTLGVEYLLSICAVGSMQPHIMPGHIVIPDQFYDLTQGRKSTFFGKGFVAHISLADPICTPLAEVAAEAAAVVGATVHRGGTYLCTEGPQFATRAESRGYRASGTGGLAVIGMTGATEAKLAREAEICYASVAMATDYDSWHTTESAVTVEQVLGVLRKNVALSKLLIQAAITRLPNVRSCPCKEALRDACVTRPEHVPAQTKKDLAPLIGKYMSAHKPQRREK